MKLRLDLLDSFQCERSHHDSPDIISLQPLFIHVGGDALNRNPDHDADCDGVMDVLERDADADGFINARDPDSN